MGTIFLFISICLIFACTESSGDYIVYGTPGSPRGRTGLYGGYYEFGKNLDMELTHIAQANSKYGTMYGTKILDEEISRAKKRPFSERAATVIAERIETVGSTLLVINKDETLHFFVQIAKPMYTTGQIDKYSLDLYEVEEGGQAKILQSSSQDTRWSRRIIKSIGDISYKDGLLCWSAYEDIFCESWPRTRNVPSLTHVLNTVYR